MSPDLEDAVAHLGTYLSIYGTRNVRLGKLYGSPGAWIEDMAGKVPAGELPAVRGGSLREALIRLAACVSTSEPKGMPLSAQPLAGTEKSGTGSDSGNKPDVSASHGLTPTRARNG